MFEGVFTALVTPFRDGAVDERALTELVELQIAAGVDGIVPCGSTGEAATLSHAEHRARRRSRGLGGARPRPGGRRNRLEQHLRGDPADAPRQGRGRRRRAADLAVLQPTDPGGRRRALHGDRAAIAFPLLVYNIPARTGSNVLPATIARLAEVDQIVGVKESCGDLNQIAHVIASVPDSFAVLSGDDWAVLPLLALGGKGAISTVSNVAPGEMVELVRAFRAGDLPRARAVHFRLLPLLDALFWERTRSR